jgi:hypothetical protein
MPRRTMPAQAGRTGWTWIALLAVLLVPGTARAAAWRPDVSASLGGTFAVLGVPSGGGSSASLSAMWPVTRRLSFGVTVHGDDAGSTVDSLRDAQGHGLSYGKVEQLHRAAWGASWRLDAAAAPWAGVTPYASATWGYYRVADDERGAPVSHVGSTGFSLGAGVRQPLGHHFALGAFVRYHRLFNDREGRFVSAGLDGTWH